MVLDKIESYLFKQDISVQEHLLKYLECGMIHMQRYIDDGKDLKDFLNDTKHVYWVVKERLVEYAADDMNLK